MFDSVTRRRLAPSWEGRVPPRLTTTLAVTVVILAGGVSSARAAGASHAPKRVVGSGTSSNWSGYAVDGTNATHVIGTWTEPAVTCAPGESSWSSPWVGIDGDNSNTVEQIGTDSDCQRGTAVYYAWYEMYPKSLVMLKMKVVAGHSYTGEVSYNATGSFTLKLTDNTTGAPSFTTTQTSSKKTARSSVEWIMEGPSSGLLSDFGSVPFSAASATISGQAGGLSSFTSPEEIAMTGSAGVRAQPSTLAANAFSVAWQHS